MKEYEKLLFEDTKRRETEKALKEVELGLFEQKQEETFDFADYELMTYGKKYKGLYDLYQNKNTLELVFVCPLVEDNKGSEDERKDLTPYAYDVLYLELLDAETYEVVKQAHVHEKTKFIDCFVKIAIVGYFCLVALFLAVVIHLAIIQSDFSSFILFCGSLIGCLIIATILLPLLLIQYRKFKAQ